ncbi:MAG: hypothetical protein JOZ19_01870 [Rubrobacter sp.]|nr:hypothetical protein [Rubrobacter sp.]
MSKTGRKAKPETVGAQVGNGLVRPKSWLKPTILLMLREWNSYVYKLIEQLTVFGFEAMNPGTMY